MRNATRARTRAAQNTLEDADRQQYADGAMVDFDGEYVTFGDLSAPERATVERGEDGMLKGGYGQ